MTQLEPFPGAVHLTRVEPIANMERYYDLAVAPDLFGGFALTRSWGRIERSCRVRVELHDSEADALAALDLWRARKQRRGGLRVMVVVGGAGLGARRPPAIVVKYRARG